MRRERPEQVLRALGEALQRAGVVEPGALELARELLVAALAQTGGVALVGAAADLLDEPTKAPADAGRLELVAQHGADSVARQRRQLEQRQIAADERLHSHSSPNGRVLKPST